MRVALVLVSPGIVHIDIVCAQVSLSTPTSPLSSPRLPYVGIHLSDFVIPMWHHLKLREGRRGSGLIGHCMGKRRGRQKRVREREECDGSGSG
ncbi:hypothetical protein CHUAL_014178 [Chamberlinius hualienensis]